MRVILLSLCKTRHQHQAEQDFHGILDPGSKVAMEILPCLQHIFTWHIFEDLHTNVIYTTRRKALPRQMYSRFYYLNCNKRTERKLRTKLRYKTMFNCQQFCSSPSPATTCRSKVSKKLHVWIPHLTVTNRLTVCHNLWSTTSDCPPTIAGAWVFSS